MKITDKELDEIETIAYLISEENLEEMDSGGEKLELRKKIRKQILENEEKLNQKITINNVLADEIKQLKITVGETNQLKKEIKTLEKTIYESNIITLNLKEQVKRELKDNNGLRETIGKQFQKLEKIEKELETTSIQSDSREYVKSSARIEKILKEK